MLPKVNSQKSDAFITVKGKTEVRRHFMPKDNDYKGYRKDKEYKIQFVCGFAIRLL